MKKNNTIAVIVNGAKSILFVVALIVGLVLNAIPSLRPTKSDSENRTLNKFPSFSLASLWNGEFFSKESNDSDNVGLSQWFADTFPFREWLTTAYGEIENNYGLRSTQAVGKIDKGDDINDDFMSKAASSKAPVSSGYQDIQDPDDGTNDGKGNVVGEQFGAILVAGDAAYEYYSFSANAAATYVNAVNTAAARLKGKAKVYDMIIPTSIAITIPSSLKASVSSGTANQLNAINTMYRAMNDGVKTIDVYTTLYKHRNDYVYFRTDHHWTQIGAYYAYVELMKTMKKEPVPLTKYSGEYRKTFDGFLGTFYATAKKPAAMTNNPDTVTALVPFHNATMNVYEADGETVRYENYPIIQDTTSYSSSFKYASTFIGSDNPFTVIENHDLTDGSACVLIKESYGNCFAPLLVAHYQTVYIVDYREYQKSIYDLVEQKGVKDVIFLNNISATRSDKLMDYMAVLSAR